MDESMGVNEMNLEQAKKFVVLKSMAYKEYLAARHLLNTTDFLHQTAFFMNTCIERELKAYLFALNIQVNFQHDTFKLLNLLRSQKPKIVEKINPDFIKVISKIYTSRYYEDLGPDYNFVIVRNKFLAELDNTFSKLESTSRLKRGKDIEIPKTNYEIGIELTLREPSFAIS